VKPCGPRFPLSRFRGEREGPVAQRGEGEVGGATNRLGGPPHPALSPRPARGEGKRSGHSGVNLTARVNLDFPRTALPSANAIFLLSENSCIISSLSDLSREAIFSSIVGLKIGSCRGGAGKPIWRFGNNRSIRQSARPQRDPIGDQPELRKDGLRSVG